MTTNPAAGPHANISVENQDAAWAVPYYQVIVEPESVAKYDNASPVLFSRVKEIESRFGRERHEQEWCKNQVRVIVTNHISGPLVTLIAVERESTQALSVHSFGGVHGVDGWPEDDVGGWVWRTWLPTFPAHLYTVPRVRPTQIPLWPAQGPEPPTPGCQPSTAEN